MLFYPKIYFEHVKDITIEFLRENSINALILDVDNTILDYEKNIPDGIKQWCDNLKKQGIKFCIVSNTNKVEKVKKAAKELDIPYFYFARKPSKIGLKKGMRLLEEKPENIAAVGDQIFTDVLGANRCKMYSILVKPLSEKDIVITKIKRPFENIIKNRYFKSLNIK